MKFDRSLTECLFVDAHDPLGHRVQQAGDGGVVDAAGIAAGKLVNQILDALVEDLDVAAVLVDLVVDVASRLILREWPKLISNTDPIDDIGVL